jgi:hypothetical protein
MYHKNYRVTGFKIMDKYVLHLRFDDESEQIINFEPVLYGRLWGPLREISLFNQVSIDPIAHTLTWPNGADFDPETLRNWAEYKDELAERAQQWEQITV